MNQREHLADECPDFWHCNRLHRLMTRKVEAELLNYPGEWVLFHRRAGVRFHGKVAREVFAEANANGGTADLVFHHVPEPGVSHFYGFQNA